MCNLDGQRESVSLLSCTVECLYIARPSAAALYLGYNVHKDTFAEWIPPTPIYTFIPYLLLIKASMKHYLYRIVHIKIKNIGLPIVIIARHSNIVARPTDSQTVTMMNDVGSLTF